MESVWWKQVTSADLFIRRIIQTLLDERSVAFGATESIPWLDTMRELVMEGVRTNNCNRSFREVYSCEAGDNPGLYLLENFCREELRASYRPGKGSYAKFLAECKESTLLDNYVWVRDISPEQMRIWINFISEYYNDLGKRMGGVFLLEFSSDMEISAKKGIQIFSYKKAISEYDRFVFNMLFATELSGNIYRRQYLAELVSVIADEDIELGAECIKSGEKFISNPYETYLELYQENRHTEDGGFSIKSEDDIERCIWITQIKLVFPLIEEYRRRFVKKWEQHIKRCLPQSDGNGNTLYEPNDLEVGTLKYLAEKNDWPLTQQELEELKFYRETRNLLAHMRTLTEVQLKKLFSYPRKN